MNPCSPFLPAPIKKQRPLALALVLAMVASPLVATAQNVVFKIPPVKIPLDVKDQPITITASAILTISSRDRNLRILNLQLTGDLSDLQRNLTSLLSAQLDKDDHCGERVAIQMPPSSLRSRRVSPLFSCTLNVGPA